MAIEQVIRIELTSWAWRAYTLTVVLYLHLEAPPRFELGPRGYKSLRLTIDPIEPFGEIDADRTRDIQSHNLTLCQLSYNLHIVAAERIELPFRGPESRVFTIIRGRNILYAVRTRLERATSTVTVWHSNQTELTHQYVILLFI